MQEKEYLTGIEKGALILLSIDKETANKILELLSEEERNKMKDAMNRVGNISEDLKQSILADFIQKVDVEIALKNLPTEGC